MNLFELVDRAAPLHVVDVGASWNGEPSYKALLDAGRAHLVGFEPDTAECERLRTIYGDRATFLPYFIGDGEPATFYTTNHVRTCSLYRANWPLLQKFFGLPDMARPCGEHAVQTHRLDDIDEVRDCDFLKIDVQGGELNVFRNGTRVLDQAVIIQTEVEFMPLYEGQPLFAEVDLFLRSRGFRFLKFSMVANNSFKPVLINDDLRNGSATTFADAIYVKDFMNLSSLSDDKLKALAILSLHVFAGVDFSHELLTELDRRRGTTWAQAFLDLMQRAYQPRPESANG